MKYCQHCGTKLGQPGCFCNRPLLAEGKTIPQPLYNLTKKFQQDIAPPFDLSMVVEQLGIWIQTHRDALLLAWFAQYGFEPGKAVLVHQNTIGESRFFIREATPKEQEDARMQRESWEKARE